MSPARAASPSRSRRSFDGFILHAPQHVGAELRTECGGMDEHIDRRFGEVAHPARDHVPNPARDG